MFVSLDTKYLFADIKLLLACIPCYCEVIEIIFPDEQEREEAFQKYVNIRKSLLGSSLLTEDVKKVIFFSENCIFLLVIWHAHIYSI